MKGPRHGPDLGELRRLAARRRVAGDRIRRLVPGVIIGSSTLVGTGVLAAWVGGQPGVTTTAGQQATRTPASTARSSQTSDPVPSLQNALQADESALQSLETGMPTIGAGTPAPAVAAAGAPATLPAIAPLPQIAMPALPQIAASPAPAVNATTGASHAIP